MWNNHHGNLKMNDAHFTQVTATLSSFHNVRSKGRGTEKSLLRYSSCTRRPNTKTEYYSCCKYMLLSNEQTGIAGKKSILILNITVIKRLLTFQVVREQTRGPSWNTKIIKSYFHKNEHCKMTARRWTKNHKSNIIVKWHHGGHIEGRKQGNNRKVRGPNIPLEGFQDISFPLPNH